MVQRQVFFGTISIIRPGWPGSMNLVNDWAYFTVFLSFFFIGYVAGSVPELLQAFEKYRLPALILGLAAFACRIAVYAVVTVPNGYNAANIVTHTFRGIAAYGLVMA